MAHIAQSRIDAIKQGVSLLDWIENEGHAPKKEGRDYVMACAFHDEKRTGSGLTFDISQLLAYLYSRLRTITQGN